ncbi:MAG: hypothetical protein RL722_835 [Pseudomonadota bacterium]|jgi:DNA-binding transcriptional LysR family regulator
MESTIDLAALQAFVKVVQTGSFTRAAEALGSHKAQVSRTLSQLERDLGARLLERSTRALSLTEVGREFHARAVAILASVDDARLAVQQAQGEPRGLLRLSCGVEFGMLAVGPWINRYLARHPQMKVEAEFTGRLVDLVHESYDLAIRLGPLADSSLAARRLGALAYGLYAAPGYLAVQGEPAHPGQLGGHALLAFSGGSQRQQWTLGDGGTTCRVPLKDARLRAGNAYTLRDAAVQGLGIALLPRLLGEPEVAQGRLQPVMPGWQPPEVEVHAVFASARYLAPKVRAFIDLAVEAFSD